MEEVAQKAVVEKQRQSAQKVDQGPPVIQGQSSAKKGKEKGITINEGSPQATQQRTGSGGTVAMVPVSVAEVTDLRLVIHLHPLFGKWFPTRKMLRFPTIAVPLF